MLKKFITVESNILHAQSKGCWLVIHYKYILISFQGWWSQWQGVRIEINAPMKSYDPGFDPDIAYQLGRYSVWMDKDFLRFPKRAERPIELTQVRRYPNEAKD